MVRLRIDQETLSLTKVLEYLSGARVKDCFQSDELIYFIVAKGDLGKAIGKNGDTVKLIKQKVNKNIKMIEFDEEEISFIRKVVDPIRIENIQKEGNTIFIRDNNKKTKSLLIGREGRKLQLLNRALQRVFPGIEVVIE